MFLHQRESRGGLVVTVKLTKGKAKCRFWERDPPRRAQFEPSDADVSGGNKNAQV